MAIVLVARVKCKKISATLRVTTEKKSKKLVLDLIYSSEQAGKAMRQSANVRYLVGSVNV